MRDKPSFLEYLKTLSDEEFMALLRKAGLTENHYQNEGEKKMEERFSFITRISNQNCQHNCLGQCTHESRERGRCRKDQRPYIDDIYNQVFENTERKEDPL